MLHLKIGLYSKERSSFLVVLLMLFFGIIPLHADFSNAYGIQTWVEETSASTSSLWNIANLPNSVTLQSDPTWKQSMDSMIHLATNAGTVTFSWTYSPGDLMPNIAGYILNGKLNYVNNIFKSGAQSGSKSFSVVVGDTFGFFVKADQTYTPRPNPVNKTATFTISNFSAPGLTTPSAPKIIQVIPSSQEATVVFTPPANDGGTEVTSYKISASPGGNTIEFGTPISIQGTNSYYMYVDGLQNEDTVFTAYAINGMGIGNPSEQFTSPMKSPCYGTKGCPPSAATITDVTAGDGSATVFFTPVSPLDSGGSPIVGYEVTSDPDNITVNSLNSPAKVTGLTNGTAYTFTVTAVNADKWGEASAKSASVTPSADGK